MTDLIDIARDISTTQLAMLRLLETWRVKKVRGKWVAGDRKVSQIAMGWLHFKNLVRVDYKPAIPEMHITGLGHQLLALKSKDAKPAAPSHQEKAA